MNKLKFNTNFFGKEVLYFDEIDSTNNEIKRQGNIGAVHGLVAIAERQTAGRGRLGRSWSSPDGDGIWMSFLLRPKIKPNAASMLTLIIALAVRKALYEVSGLDTLIKWPNDIVVNGKKLCGILTEMSTTTNDINYVAAGVGINVNTEKFPKEINNTATSIRIECGRQILRETLIEKFGEIFEEYYDEFLRTEDLSIFKEEYNGYLANKDKIVKIMGADEELTGTALGINEQGELLVRDSNNQLYVIRSGEVSVRGIYGYV